MKAVIFDYNRTIYDPDTNALMPGAKYILDFLKKHGVKLFLIAKGDDERKKQIETLGLTPYFERVIVNQNKSSEDFQVCIDTCPAGTNFFAVGDRVKEEIRHANQCGITTLWLRNGKFASEVPSNDSEQPKFIISKLEEVEKIVFNDSELK